MGLTYLSTGLSVNNKKSETTRKNKVIALAGNPNVGKSSIFNELTGLKQHTGNWAGKTVTNACADFSFKDKTFTVADIPGTYSLYANSKEEEVARDFICFSQCDGAVVVCDANCLERNLNLALQVIEAVPNTIVCVNLIDEAEKKGITINERLLEKLLGVPVVLTSAAKKINLDKLKETIYNQMNKERHQIPPLIYSPEIRDYVCYAEDVIEKFDINISGKWLALKLIEGDKNLLLSINDFLGFNPLEDEELNAVVSQAVKSIERSNSAPVSDVIVSMLIKKAENIAQCATKKEENKYSDNQLKIDRILTGKYTAVPFMLLLLAAVFWITIKGANYPSQMLSKFLFSFQDNLYSALSNINAPAFIKELIVFGIYKVVAWVVSVMLPPMAIFFPLFTLLEDLGYLPRIAFNLDRCFRKCRACGKQSLTMAMGFGCNAAGVVGCRIIDSPRERLIAIITNSMVPCNGRFPTLIAIIAMFFAGSSFSDVVSAIILTFVIFLSIAVTFLSSYFLSATVLKGVASSFTLELPPYRKPQIIKLIVRSIFDRTLFVLGRAVTVAIPAGVLIFLLANVKINDLSLLGHISDFLDPFAALFGLDGVILLAFILGFPANEIVIPIILMAYLCTSSLSDYSSLTQLKQILADNGWTWLTALCTMIFSLFHWPCSTTCLTIKKETKSLKWTLISFAMPPAIGFLLCFAVTCTAKIFNLV